jgi:23S rRNA pseudouridine1911/1915/1917 synthase
MPGPEVVEVEVPASLAGERVDRALALLLGVSRARASALVSGGHARLAGEVARAGSRRLTGGEVLQVDLSSHGSHRAGGGPDEPPPPLARDVFHDDCLVVVDKPAGLVVHPGAGHAGSTLVDQLAERFPAIRDVGPDDERPGIVHRLDKGTSGLLVAALTEAARRSLVSQMAARRVERRYLAVVHGLPEADEGVVDAPLGRSPSHRVKMAVVEGGRSARTRYSVLARSAVPLPVALVACQLESGRTHQIRAHMAAIGHPVLADERYGRPDLLAAARGALPELRRPWLHAARLAFAHPLTGDALAFVSPLPEELSGTLPVLGLRPPVADWLATGPERPLQQASTG